ncbi:hypothetical protein EXIGLDRAFT_737549 [Exidia glandulosa HHB12029]|uniref:F-box domain-containing protein n=1 Tax=Exidia glandulosa HHB12029 TaxID=1314781 RepID=A0A166MWK0_EXIGL|nr:hypothetical protein EXIGLDRAFT_737549 [Exidia glandulosa HHB12029]
MPPRRRTAPPRPSRFVGLPTELLTMIASYLSLVELARVLVLYRDWHALLTATPFLWQLVHIDFEEYPDFPLVRFLGYSKGLPLSLRLRSISPRQIETVMSAVGANMNRTRILKLWLYECFNEDGHKPGDDRAITSADLDCISAPFLHPAPLLEHFTIAITKGLVLDALMIPGERGPMFGGDAPRLTHVTHDADFLLHWDDETAYQLDSYTEFSNKTVPELMDRCPNLETLRFCGDWSLLNSLPPGVDPSDPKYWDGIPSVGWAFAGCTAEDCDEIVSYLHSAIQHGVRDWSVRAAGNHTLLLDGFLREAGDLVSLCIAMGGYDFGLQRDWNMGVGVYVQFSTPQGVSLTVGDSRDVKGADNAGFLRNRVAMDLLGCFETHHFANLTVLTICESVSHYMNKYLGTLELPQLTTLTIWIVPPSQRRSPQLFDCVPEHEGPEPFIAAWHTPKLDTLYLGSHPEFPVGACGYFIREWQEDFIVAHVREVSAVSVADFILDNLTFKSLRLPEILLARDVVFAEGFHGEETDRVRELTDELRYLRVGETGP